MKLSLFLSSILASLTFAQYGPYTDFKSGISYQAFTDKTGYTFGIALPAVPSGDFIGLLTGKGTSWVGVSLGGSMVNKLLIAAWPNGKTPIASFRKTPKIQSPPEATGSFTLLPIANGTYTNSTHWSLTFLCKACIATDGTTFSRNATTDMLGWAYSDKAPTTPTSKSTGFAKHGTQGQYAANFSGARSTLFETWAAYAPKAVVGRENKEAVVFLG